MSDELTTPRLVLRQWQEQDRQIFAALNDNPCVMRYFPRHFNRTESDAFIDNNIAHIQKYGWGAWAVERKDTQEFIGFVGFSHPASWHPCAGKIDIGWRLSQTHWGAGYATEAALTALSFGIKKLAFSEIVSYTSERNTPSISVMKKLGMVADLEGFEHPRIHADSPLRKHVVYRIFSH